MNAVEQTRLSSGETYLSYVSPLLLRGLAGRHATDLAPAERVHGAVALIDVEGFSAFAERMAGRGGDGLEQLSVKINETFARMVQEIERSGGIAHAFPGDSVIALWPADHDEKSNEQAVLAATRCALGLLETHRDGELPLKAGMSCGEMQLVHAGGIDGRHHLLLCGEALDHMGRAEERASRGRLIVANAAWRLLAPHAVAAVEADGFFEVKSLRPSSAVAIVPPILASPAVESMGSGLLDRVCAYLPEALLRQLDAGHDAWLGEFREISTVFVRIAAAGASASAAQENVSVIAHAFREVQRVVHRHGGDVMRFAHDDKGLAVLSAFGLPPSSSEQLAMRAVQSALEIERIAPTLRIECRIGIATGRVFCGTLGAPSRREFSIVGSAPNLAARLMQMKSAGVLCDAATAAAAADVCSFERAYRVQLKGLAEPVDAYLATAASGPAVRTQWCREPTRLVGRDADCARLRAWIDGLRDRSGAVAVVQGEAGVGKSTLLADAVAHANESGVSVLGTACHAVEISNSYAAWSKLLSELLRLDTLRTTGEKSARVVAALRDAGAAAEFAPLLAPVLGVDIEENELTREMTGSARGESLLASLSRLVVDLCARRRGAGETILLVFEDVHWLDASSWQLLQVLSRGLDASSPGILLTLRSETTPASPDWHAVVHASDVESILVAPLAVDPTRELVRHLLGADEVSAALLQLVFERTRGNPFFCEQLLSSLSESGLVTVESGSANLRIKSSEQMEAAVPRSVAAVVTSRLDRLPAPVQLTLKAASVIGAHFRIAVLEAIHPTRLELASIGMHLATAIELGLVEAVEDGTAYRFRHAITCDVAYALLLISQRRSLHRRVAEVLSAGETASAQALLFYHWRRSGDEKRALEHVDHAGAEAMRNGNYHAATELFGYALQTVAGSTDAPAAEATASRAPREAVWSGNLGEAQAAIGLNDAARSSLELCLQKLGEAPPARPVSLALAVAREAVRQGLHRLFPEAYEGSGRESAERLALAARAFEQLGFVYYSCGETTRGLYAALRILNLSELAGLRELMARSYAVMSLTASVVRLRRLALLYDRRAVELARETDDAAAQAYVGWVTGVRAAGEAQWNLVRMRVENSRMLAEHVGDRRLHIMALQTLAWPAYVQGEFDVAAGLAQSQLAIARESNNRLWEAWGLSSLAEVAMMLGDDDAAIGYSQRSLDVLADEPDRVGEIRTLGVLAVSHYRCARPQQACDLARRALGLIRQTDLTDFSMYEGFAGICEVMVSLVEDATGRGAGVSAAQRRDMRASLHAFAGFARVFLLARPRLHALRARVVMLHGDPSAARREFDRALRAADEVAMSHEKGLSLMMAARSAAFDPHTRRRRAEEALVTLKSSHARRQAETALRELSP